MRVLVIAALAALVAATSVLGASDLRRMFADFKVQYERKYASPTEEAARFAIFAANMERAAELQAANPLATFGVNEFADLTPAEFKAYHNCDAGTGGALANETRVDLSDELKLAAQGQAIDWRAKGAVTPVKSQGACGSCWAFGATGSIEGQWFLAGNKLVSLSEQELVSCDKTAGGCAGGTIDGTLVWLLKNQGGAIVTEASYPYVSNRGANPACNLNNRQFGARIIGYELLAKNEATMAAWVYAKGPLAVSVWADGWGQYTGGILTSCRNTRVDHAVLIVGFNDNHNPPYWIIKNTWGVNWGEKGYIRVKKGGNLCAITTFPLTANVAKRAPTPAPTPKPTPAPTPKPTTTTTTTTTAAPTTTTGAPPTTTAAPTTTMAPNTTVAPATTTASPETTAPAPTSPSGGTFVQSNCGDSNCSGSCVNTTYNLGECLALEGGGSAVAACQSGMVALTEYPSSESCTGPWFLVLMPLDECLARNSNTTEYFQNYCLDEGVAAAAGGVLRSGNVLRSLRSYVKKSGDIVNA